MQNTFNRYTLDCGATVLTEHLPHSRTVSAGVWLGYGSRLEEPGFYGAAHFIEHMLFKGTPGKSPKDIALAFESVGGSFNASASKENTNIFARMLADHLPLAVNLLCDMACASTFPGDEFDREKLVVLEEIWAHMDEPEEVAYDIFKETIYGSDGVGHPILGTEETVRGMTRDDLYGLYRKYYRPAHFVIAVAGNLESFDVPALVNDALGADDGPPCAVLTGEPGESDFTPRIRLEPRDTHQVHFFMGMPGVPYRSPDRYVYAILDMILSGGMSSRLFQEVREKRGLVYDIASENTCYSDKGLFSVYAATSIDNLGEVVSVTCEELRKVRDGDITGEEVQRVKEQLRAYMLMSLESVNSRMMKLARCELYYGRDLSDEEILDMITSVNLDDIARVAGEILRRDHIVFSALGPFSDKNRPEISARIGEILEKLL